MTSSDLTPDNAVDIASAAAIARAARKRLTDNIRSTTSLLGRFVRRESPGSDIQSLNQTADMISELFGRFGNVRQRPLGRGGTRHIVIDLDGSAGRDSGRLVAIGHYDTPHPKGHHSSSPFRLNADVATGSGIADKAGIASLFLALSELNMLGMTSHRPLRVILMCDGHDGGATARRVVADSIDDLVLGIDIGLGGPNGELVSETASSVLYRLVVSAGASNQGHGHGNSVAKTIATLIDRIDGLADEATGVASSVVSLKGGSGPDLPFDGAEIVVELSTTSPQTRSIAQTNLIDLTLATAPCVVTIDPLSVRPAIEASAESHGWIGQIQSIARAAGLGELNEISSPDARDAGLISAFEAPAIGGLGAVGSSSRYGPESVSINALIDRASLLTGMFARL